MPPEVYIAEFTNQININKIAGHHCESASFYQCKHLMSTVAGHEVMSKKGTRLPVRAPEGVHDTANYYERITVSFGRNWGTT